LIIWKIYVYILSKIDFGLNEITFVKQNSIYRTCFTYKNHDYSKLLVMGIVLILSYHQGCISCINYPSNKLSFIRWVLNKSRRHNSLGQCLVVVSSVFFWGFHSLFCPICLMCLILFKYVVDHNYVCHLIQYWSTAISRKK